MYACWFLCVKVIIIFNQLKDEEDLDWQAASLIQEFKWISHQTSQVVGVDSA